MVHHQKAQVAAVHQSRTLAAIAEKNDLHLRRIKRKVYTEDPRRKAILARIAWAIRHLPPGAVVLFMDEKGPITVKRYGGFIWTTAKRVIMHKNQKTRGKFYLFGVYEFFSGHTRWRYYDRSRSDEFIVFMEEIRHWYPHQSILVVLDQDTTHPQTCKASQRAMRRLKIHWLSLPKGSPDDNPLEVGYPHCSSNRAGYKVTELAGAEST